MSWLALACEAAIAVTLVWAAVAKVRAPAATAAGFERLGLPFPWLLARVVPTLELLVAFAVLAAPAVGGALALLLLMGFTAVLVVELRRDTGAGCACFGSSPTRPVSWRHVARNAVLVGAAIVILVAG